MKKRKLTILIPIFLVSLISSFFFFTIKKPAQYIDEKDPERKMIKYVPQEGEIRASFAIYLGNKMWDFSSPIYHERFRDVFTTQAEPQVIIIKNPETTWGDYFETMPHSFNLTEFCLTDEEGQLFCTNASYKLTFMLNGELIRNPLLFLIEDGDKLLVSYGNDDFPTIQNQYQSIPEPY